MAQEGHAVELYEVVDGQRRVVLNLERKLNKTNEWNEEMNEWTKEMNEWNEQLNEWMNKQMNE